MKSALHVRAVVAPHEISDERSPAPITSYPVGHYYGGGGLYGDIAYHYSRVVGRHVARTVVFEEPASGPGLP